MKNTYKKLFVGFVVLILVFPMGYFVGGKEATKIYGREVIYPLPDIHALSFLNKDFQKAFEKWWESHFLNRTVALKIKNQIYDWVNLRQFHSGHNRAIVQGQKKYLYEKAYFRSILKNCSPLTDAPQKLGRLKNILSKRGINVFFVLAPNKVVTYKEYTPDLYKYFSGGGVSALDMKKLKVG